MQIQLQYSANTAVIQGKGHTAFYRFFGAGEIRPDDVVYISKTVGKRPDVLRFTIRDDGNLFYSGGSQDDRAVSKRLLERQRWSVERPSTPAGEIA